MKSIAQVILLAALAGALAQAQAQERVWSTSLGAGADVKGDMTAGSLSFEWLPRSPEFDWGVVAYGMVGHDSINGTSGILAAMPVVTWKWGRVRPYLGVGAAVNTTTSQLGTPVNFAIRLGAQIDLSERWALGFTYDHLSHASKAGIAKDKPNGGVDMVSGQIVYRF